MNVERREELLAAYVSGDVTDAERAEVDEALAASAEWREALAAHRDLEAALSLRRDEIPALAPFLAGVFRPAGTAHRRERRARVVLDALFSVPAVAAAGCTALAIATYVYRGNIAVLIGEAGQGERIWRNISAGVTQTLLAFTGGDPVALVTACTGLTVVALLSTGLVTLRFLRDDA